MTAPGPHSLPDLQLLLLKAHYLQLCTTAITSRRASGRGELRPRPSEPIPDVGFSVDEILPRGSSLRRGARRALAFDAGRYHSQQHHLVSSGHLRALRDCRNRKSCK
jgi:hypothetical protein